MREIAISDIHGCVTTFKTMVKDVLKLSKQDKLYLLGDYIDRGPDSKGVIDFIINLQESGYQVYCLKGNHEDMFLKAHKEGGNSFDIWYWNGGDACLKSFDLLVDLSGVAPKYWNFMDSLQCYIETPAYFLVHAGFNFRSDNILEDEQSMLWIRNWYNHINNEWLNGKVIVHGHTPTPKQEITQLLESKPLAINIDSGCFIYGDMCAFDMTNQKLYFQPNLDMDESY